MRAVVLGMTMAAAAAAPIAADPFKISSKNRRAAFSSQLGVLDGRAASQYAGSSRLKPNVVTVPTRLGTEAIAVPRFTGRYSGPYLPMARAAARRHRIPEDLFVRLVQQESGWNATARSRKGALGLAQLMPMTAKQLRVDPLDPEQNLDGGARYLRQQFDRFRDWSLALAAYNAGPGAVESHGGVPPFRETRTYIRKILGG